MCYKSLYDFMPATISPSSCLFTLHLLLLLLVGSFAQLYIWLISPLSFINLCVTILIFLLYFSAQFSAFSKYICLFLSLSFYTYTRIRVRVHTLARTQTHTHICWWSDLPSPYHIPSGSVNLWFCGSLSKCTKNQGHLSEGNLTLRSVCFVTYSKRDWDFKTKMNRLLNPFWLL